MVVISRWTLLWAESWRLNELNQSSQPVLCAVDSDFLVSSNLLSKIHVSFVLSQTLVHKQFLLPLQLVRASKAQHHLLQRCSRTASPLVLMELLRLFQKVLETQHKMFDTRQGEQEFNTKKAKQQFDQD